MGNNEDDIAKVGHNSGTVEGAKLRAFIERVERLEEDKKEVADDINDVYAEAKSTGYDVTVLRKIVAARKQDLDKRREQQEIMQLYCSALGLPDLFL